MSSELKQVKDALETIVRLASQVRGAQMLTTIENEASDALVELERYQESRLRILENVVPGGVSDHNFSDELVQRIVEGVTGGLKKQAGTSVVLDVPSGIVTVDGDEDRLGAAILRRLGFPPDDDGRPRKVTILIGIPGSGKSTWAAKQDGATVVSADTYHIGPDGVYRYEPDKAGEAHLWCYRCFVYALKRGDEHVIVDNTNTQNWERSPYVKHAQLLGYTVEFKRFQCNVELAVSRNVHSVPREIVEKMAARLEEPSTRWGEVEEIETDTGDA